MLAILPHGRLLVVLVSGHIPRYCKYLMSTYLITKYNYRTCFQNEEICSIVYEILHMLHQKSANQHRKFAQLRKELLIVSTCTPHGARFKWGGIFYIDRAQFVRFIRAGYSVLTFLLNFHSWWSFEVFSDCNLPIKCSIKFNQMFALFFFFLRILWSVLIKTYFFTQGHKSSKN